MPSFKLNLKHLRYFWAVASHGSIVKASRALCLTPQTISGQLRVLEQQVGAKLFRREGRALGLTDVGRTVYAYADEMFRLGTELQEVLEGRIAGNALTVQVGIAPVVPELLAHRLLEPVLNMAGAVRLICHAGPLVDLLGQLAVHKLDVILTGSPLAPGLNLRAYDHLLGTSGVSFFASPPLARELPGAFPACLDGMPMLMPGSASSRYRELEAWFSNQGVSPRTLAQFDNRTLMEVFGAAGAGLFTSPTAVETEVSARYGVQVIGRTTELTERYYALSAERRIGDPAVAAIADRARTLFA